MYDLPVILLLYVLETSNVLLLGPLAPFLLLHYGTIDNLDNSSLYSGYFSAVYYVGQIICNYPLCCLSEKYGKKRVILFGTATTILFNVLFIFSTNLYTSLIIRFLYGLFNANFCLLRVFISDISKKEDITANYAYLTCAWAMGAFTASLISMTFNENLKYPLVWPMLISSGITFIIFCLAFIFLENKEKEKEEKKEDNIIPQITIITVAVYLLFSSMETIYYEIAPVLFASKNFNYSEKQIGLLLTINNFVGFITSLVFDKIVDVVGQKNLMCVSVSLISFMLLAISFTHLYSLICIFTSIRMMLSNWTFSVIFVYLASVPNMNRINGVSQTLGSLIKILFPIIFTNIFHYLKNDINIVFAIIVGISLFIIIAINKL